MAPQPPARHRRRIAIVLPSLAGGGAERVMLELGRVFARRGNEVSFVVLRDGGALYEEVSSEFDVSVLHTNRIRYSFVALRSWLRAREPDAVFVGIWPLTVLTAFAAWGLSLRPKVVVSDHNYLSEQYAARGTLHRLLLRASIAVGYRMVAARVGVSRGVSRDLAALGCFRSSLVTTIHNPVRLRSTGNADDANLVWRPNFGKRLLTVGNLKPQKNQALLLRAFALLARTETLQLAILGEGELRGALERQAKSLGIAKRVFLPGYVADPTPYYETADLFVLPSDAEGFGLVLVEALAAGLPIVATDCPFGPREVLDDGRFGELAPVNDAHMLSQAMLRALYKDHDKEALRSRARAFTPERAGSEYLALLQHGNLR